VDVTSELEILREQLKLLTQDVKDHTSALQLLSSICKVQSDRIRLLEDKVNERQSN
jgi:hypothetical protein